MQWLSPERALEAERYALVILNRPLPEPALERIWAKGARAFVLWEQRKWCLPCCAEVSFMHHFIACPCSGGSNLR